MRRFAPYGVVLLLVAGFVSLSGLMREAGAQSTLPACVAGTTYSWGSATGYGGCSLGYGTSANVTISRPANATSGRAGLYLVLPAGAVESTVCSSLSRSGGTLQGCPGDASSAGEPAVLPPNDATTVVITGPVPAGSYFELRSTSANANTFTYVSGGADGITTTTTTTSTTTTAPPTTTTTSTTTTVPPTTTTTSTTTTTIPDLTNRQLASVVAGSTGGPLIAIGCVVICLLIVIAVRS